MVNVLHVQTEDTRLLAQLNAHGVRMKGALFAAEPALENVVNALAVTIFHREPTPASTVLMANIQIWDPHPHPHAKIARMASAKLVMDLEVPNVTHVLILTMLLKASASLAKILTVKLALEREPRVVLLVLPVMLFPMVSVFPVRILGALLVMILELNNAQLAKQIII